MACRTFAAVSAEPDLFRVPGSPSAPPLHRGDLYPTGCCPRLLDSIRAPEAAGLSSGSCSRLHACRSAYPRCVGLLSSGGWGRVRRGPRFRSTLTIRRLERAYPSFPHGCHAGCVHHFVPHQSRCEPGGCRLTRRCSRPACATLTDGLMAFDSPSHLRPPDLSRRAADRQVVRWPTP